MKPEVLNALDGGIDRQRVKGSPSPKVLYDLLNGYVDRAGKVVARDGVEVDAVLPSGTKGLVSFEGAFVVFSHEVVSGMPDGYTCEVVAHPTNPDLELHAIHYAAPFLGNLYISAEFSNGDVFHYWLLSADTWAANTVHQLGDLVQPTEPNGLVYKCTRLLPPNPLWAAGVKRTVGDLIEPTTDNGFYYEAIEVGDDGASGATEPEWPTEDGAEVTEYASLPTVTPPTQPTPDATGTPTSDVLDRYGDFRKER